MRYTKAGISRQLARWLDRVRGIKYAEWKIAGFHKGLICILVGDIMRWVDFYLKKPFKKQSRRRANAWLACTVICDEALAEESRE